MIDDDYTAFYDCFQNNAGSYGSYTSPTPGPSAAGTWRSVFLDQDTGNEIIDVVGSYLWGYAAGIVPGGQTVYLVEFPVAGATFNLSQQPVAPIVVETAYTPDVGGGYTRIGVLSSVARPAIALTQPEGANGSGGGDLVGNLVLEDRDGDGLLDVQLTDGTWAGFNRCEGAFVSKP